MHLFALSVFDDWLVRILYRVSFFSIMCPKEVGHHKAHTKRLLRPKTQNMKPDRALTGKLASQGRLMYCVEPSRSIHASTTRFLQKDPTLRHMSNDANQPRQVNVSYRVVGTTVVETRRHLKRSRLRLVVFDLVCLGGGMYCWLETDSSQGFPNL